MSGSAQNAVLLLVALCLTMGMGCEAPDDDATSPTESPTPDTRHQESVDHATATPDVSNAYMPQFCHSIETLPDGTLLIADGGASPGGNGQVLKMAFDGTKLWFISPLAWPHSIRQNAEGNFLVSETGEDRILVVTPDADILWNSQDVSPFSDGSVLAYPNDAQWLTNNTMLVTERYNHRVIELDTSGKVLWQFGETSISGNDDVHLNGPHNGKRLPNGNTMVCDSGNNRILEITPAKDIVWTFSGDVLEWPRNADVLDNNDVLIVSSGNGIVLEVVRDGAVLWQVGGLDMPYDADRLPDGRTIVSTWHAIYWFGVDGSIVQCYPLDAEGCAQEQGDGLLSFNDVR